MMGNIWRSGGTLRVSVQWLTEYGCYRNVHSLKVAGSKVWYPLDPSEVVAIRLFNMKVPSGETYVDSSCSEWLRGLHPRMNLIKRRIRISDDYLYSCNLWMYGSWWIGTYNIYLMKWMDGDPLQLIFAARAGPASPKDILTSLSLISK